MNKYYVYIYIDPRNNLPFYVGKGHNKRWTYHLNLNNKYYNLYLRNKIKSIRQKGYEPIVEKIKKNLSDKKAVELEKILIKLYGRKDNNTGTLVNHTDGGDGSEGRICNLSTRRKMSKNQRGISRNKGEKNPQYGKSNTKEQKRKISLALVGNKNPRFGIHLSKETKEKLRLANLGKKYNQETKRKHYLNSFKRKRDKLGKFIA